MNLTMLTNNFSSAMESSNSEMVLGFAIGALAVSATHLMISCLVDRFYLSKSKMNQEDSESSETSDSEDEYDSYSYGSSSGSPSSSCSSRSRSRSRSCSPSRSRSRSCSPSRSRSRSRTPMFFNSEAPEAGSSGTRSHSPSRNTNAEGSESWSSFLNNMAKSLHESPASDDVDMDMDM